MAGALRRLTRELAEMQKDPPPGCSAGLKAAGDFFVWDASIMGPPGTPFEGGIFQLSVTFPADYPFKPPKLSFLTPIYHPNISADGQICVDILGDGWGPALTLGRVLLSLISLLSDPNPANPLRPEVATQLKTDRAAYEKVSLRLHQEALPLPCSSTKTAPSLALSPLLSSPGCEGARSKARLMFYRGCVCLNIFKFCTPSKTLHT